MVGSHVRIKRPDLLAYIDGSPQGHFDVRSTNFSTTVRAAIVAELGINDEMV
jgi:hypothetical protein